MTRTPLARLVSPRSVALVGASERDHSAGKRVLAGILAGKFAGAVYPVNPRYETVLGCRAYPSLAALPEVPDVVFIAIPAEQIAGVVREAGALGVKAIMTNASGFADAGPEGEARQRELVVLARSYGMVLCGPNNSGLINLWDRFCPSTFYDLPVAGPGPVAVVSQSGSISAALSQDDRGLGIGLNITTGTEAVLGLADYVGHVVEDDRIDTVMCFVEILREPARFARAAERARELGKTIIVTKVGRSEGGRAAAAAHSGALVGDDALYGAFFDRLGVIRAADLDEMIEIAGLCRRAPAPRAEGVVVVTMSGGEAGLISDVAEAVGLPLMALDPAVVTALRPDVSPYLSPRNPLDSMGLGWDVARFRRIMRTLAADPRIGTVAISSDASGAGVGDQLMVGDMATVCAAGGFGDLRIVFFTNTAGGGPNARIDAQLRAAGIPFLCGMRAALGAMGAWRRHHLAPRAAAVAVPTPAVTGFAGAAEDRRFALLRQAGVPMVGCVAVGTPEAARAAAASFGGAVVLKATAPDLLHKSELGLVRLGLTGPEAVSAAFDDLAAGLARHAQGPGAAVVVQPMAQAGIELIIAVRQEPGFGQVVVAGLGGVFVELLRESALRLGTVDADEARAMLRETRAGRLLAGFRGKGPYDLDAAAEAIAALSRFAAAQGDLTSIEINPLIVLEAGKGAFGVDVAVETAASPVAEECCA